MFLQSVGKPGDRNIRTPPLLNTFSFYSTVILFITAPAVFWTLGSGTGRERPEGSKDYGVEIPESAFCPPSV